MSTKTLALLAIVACGALGGVVTAYVLSRAPQLEGALGIAGAAITLLPGFIWLREDGKENGYRRSPWFNIGIVLLALVFVPLYFYRSRKRGFRLRPILFFLGLVAFFYLAVIIFGIAGLSLFQTIGA